MSRGQLARTPENFPRMNHRAAGRLQRKRGHNKVTLTEALDAFSAIVKFINDGLDSLVYAFQGIARAFKPEPTQADFILSNQLVTPPMAMMARPQDWELPARAMLWPGRSEN